MSAAEAQSPVRSSNRPWKTWNQKIHIYLGLYFLVFLWLFAVSGLLLNHGWKFADFWPQRQETKREQQVAPPNAGADLQRAHDLMRQLGLSGEVEWTAARPAPERFEFRVQRPGRTVDVRVNVATQTAAVQEIRVNGWGALRMLHTFTGTRANAPTAQRDWWLTKLWSISMDALAVGLGLLVFTSVVLAIQRREKWLGSAIALALGLGACGFFVFGLRWL